MKNILCLNKIAAIGTDKLDRAEYNVGTDVQNPDAILVLEGTVGDDIDYAISFIHEKIKKMTYYSKES